MGFRVQRAAPEAEFRLLQVGRTILANEMTQIRRKLAVVGVAICLLALVVHPATAGGLAALAAVVLPPVLLFGLMLVPRSLWPSMNLEPYCAVPVLCRAGLFVRPPPFSIL